MQDYPPQQHAQEPMPRRSNTKTRTEQRGATPEPSATAEGTSGRLTSVQLARELGVSPDTIHRARREGRLHGIPHGAQGFVFERTDTLQVGDIRKQTNAVMRSKYEGERDSSVVEMLERGATIAEITIETKTEHAVVSRLRQAWLTGRETERRESTARCKCGAPPHPHVAMCKECFRRSRPLTDAESALLSGRPLPDPNTCICLGCAETTPNEDAEHLCHRCKRKLKIGVHGGVLAITLDDDTVRVLSVEETRDLVRQLAHHLPAPATEAIAPPPILPVIPDEPARQSISERIKKLKEELETP